LVALSSFRRLLERRPSADRLPGCARDQRSASVPYYGSWLSK
jgi:hypothetical protein